MSLDASTIKAPSPYGRDVPHIIPVLISQGAPHNTNPNSTQSNYFQKLMCIYFQKRPPGNCNLLVLRIRQDRFGPRTRLRPVSRNYIFDVWGL
ncbi:hypothetical protein MTP99_016590 [Tenebrio molitor]|nr:hypothetical protein MTP99_016590 [Tenebrio molitor]